MMPVTVWLTVSCLCLVAIDVVFTNGSFSTEFQHSMSHVARHHPTHREHERENAHKHNYYQCNSKECKEEEKIEEHLCGHALIPEKYRSQVAQAHVAYHNHPHSQRNSKQENQNQNQNQYTNQHQHQHQHPRPRQQQRRQHTRNLQESDDTFQGERIRIVPFWGTLEAQLEGRADDLRFIQELVSAAIRYVSEFVYVTPVSTASLTLPQKCYSKLVYNSNGDYRCLYAASFREYCNAWDTFAIPESHFAEQTVYNIEGDVIGYSEGGSGVANADLILYVSAGGDQYCAGSVAAFAMVCATDQFGRPIAGYIHVCERTLSKFDWHEDMDIILHELLHVLILHGNWFSFANANTVTNGDGDAGEIITEHANLKWVSTANLQTLARAHFDCADIPGIPLYEDTVHLHPRLVNYELMIPRNVNGHQTLSPFLLTLMKDSGHYRDVDLEFGEPFYWGYKAGCAFFTDDCVSKETHESNFVPEFCDAMNENGCTFDHRSMSRCVMKKYNTNIANVEQRYFSDPTVGGTSFLDYCPIQQMRIKAKYEPNFKNECVDERGNTIISPDSKFDTYFGFGSKCIVGYEGDGTQNGICVKLECYDYNMQENSFHGVQIIFPGEIIHCTREDMYDREIFSHTQQLSILCPDIDIVCVGQEPDLCIRGYYSTKYRACLCVAGYTGKYCNIEDRDIIGHDPVIMAPPPTLKPTGNPSTSRPTGKPTARPTEEPTQTSLTMDTPTGRPITRGKPVK